MRKKFKNFEVEGIDDINNLETLKEKWNSLLKENATKTVELSYEWQLNYWKYFNENSKLFVVIVKEGHDIVGIAPLKITNIRRFGIRVRRLEFIAGKESNYQDFIIGNNKDSVIQCIFQFIIDNRNHWDLLSLVNIPETSRTIICIDDSIGKQFFGLVKDIHKCIFLDIDMPYEEYIEVVRKKRRKYVERCVRKIKREGEIDFYHCETEDSLILHMEKLFELHRKLWNDTDTPSEFNNQGLCKFYLESVRKLLQKKEINLSVLTFNNTIVSLLLSFLFDGECILQLTAYDSDYKALSPSIVLWHFFIKEAFENNVKMIDFGTYYPYKELWGNKFRNKISFEIYPKRAFISYYFYSFERIYSFLRKYLRKFPAVVHFVRKARQKGSSKSNNNESN